MGNSKENPGGHCTWDTFVKIKSNALFVLGHLDCHDLPHLKVYFSVFFMTRLLSFSNSCSCFNSVKDGATVLKLQPHGRKENPSDFRLNIMEVSNTHHSTLSGFCKENAGMSCMGFPSVVCFLCH